MEYGAPDRIIRDDRKTSEPVEALSHRAGNNGAMRCGAGSLQEQQQQRRVIEQQP